MAKKYGGKFSPDAKPAAEKTNKAEMLDRITMRKRLRNLRTYRNLAFPIAIGGIISIFSGAPFTALNTIGAALATMLSTEVIKAGVEAEAAYDARAIARKPGWPRKLIGSAMLAMAMGVAAWVNTNIGLLGGLGVGLFTMAGMIMNFGTDPMRDKGLSGENQYQANRTAEAIEKAEAIVGEIREYARNFKDRALRLDVESLTISAEETFRQIEEDPAEYRSARRYLGVYLQGARDATAQYVALPSQDQTAEATQKYQALIRELDAGFRNKQQLMLEDNRNSLNIEIDVLRERLAAEGIQISKEK